MNLQMLFEKYSFMMKEEIGEDIMNQTQFYDFVQSRLEGMKYVEVEHAGDKSFLYYGKWGKNSIPHYFVPAYGYYMNDEKMAYRLFQKFADEVADHKTCEFSVNLYAMDVECINAFHMMQFGNMAEKCIKKMEKLDKDSKIFDIKVMKKEDILNSWEEIWTAADNIVSHLKSSPVFYPGTEFTEEVYKDFFLSPEVELISAYADGKLVGIIEWNREENDFLCGKLNSVNIGEIFVYPEYRRTGLAERLLRYAEKRAIEEGYKYMWVEHGTANPNARGFWNKYFKTYQYELTRSI